MYDSPFTPLGPTYLVGTNPVQILANANTSYSSMRVFNTSSAPVRIGFISGPVNPGNINTAAPLTGTPSQNVLSIPGNGKETMSLPLNSWVQASAPSLEVTPGEGFE